MPKDLEERLDDALKKGDAEDRMETKTRLQEMAGEKKTQWGGTYNGVNWEIQNFGERIHGEPGGNWTFYLYFHLNKIPKENDPDSFWLSSKPDDKGRVHYDYYKHGILSSIEWHCGMTWYSKESGFDGAIRTVKAGCDYSHYWDEQQSYNVEYVLMEVKDAIDSFRKMVPGYKYHCGRWGGLHSPSEVEILENGTVKCPPICKEKFDKKWPKKPDKSRNRPQGNKDAKRT